MTAVMYEGALSPHLRSAVTSPPPARSTPNGEADATPVSGDKSSGRLSALIGLLEQQHAVTLRMLEELGPALSRVIDACGDDHPALHILSVQYDALAMELAAHYRVEEQLLFPAIRRLEECMRDGTKPKLPVSTAIRMRMIDHQSASFILRRIREGRASFAADPGEEVATVLRTFDEIDRALSGQIALENEVLFPLALALEERKPP